MQELNITEDIGSDLEFMYPVFDLLSNGIVISTDSSTIVYCNPAFCKISGYSREEVVGGNPGMLRSGHHDAKFYEDLWQSITKHGHWSGEIWNRRKSGQIYAQHLEIIKVQSKRDFKKHYLAISSDVSYSKFEAAKELNLSMVDVLTKLPNRRSFEENFSRIIDSIAGDSTKTVTLVRVDILDFAQINAQYGHVAGDKLLAKVASKLRSITHVAQFVARLGGADFIVLMQTANSKDEIADYCSKLQSDLATTYTIDQIPIELTLKTSTCSYPLDGRKLTELLAKLK